MHESVQTNESGAYGTLLVMITCADFYIVDPCYPKTYCQLSLLYLHATFYPSNLL